MLTCVESIVDGTWGGGPPPGEWVHFCLMQRMRWSWADLTGEEGGTPDYVVRYCYDFLGIVADYEAEQTRKANKQAEKARNGG